MKSGYYDGMVVHRVDPGYVTQFGAPFGDGYGGPEGKASIPCETSPLPFAPLTVGIALSGRDTGSSQLFVMHARSRTSTATTRSWAPRPGRGARSSTAI